jgi:hypothetical protein
MPGSGFVPSGIYGAKLGAMAAILAETAAYATFVGEEVAELGAAGMYFYGLDRRELALVEESFADAFVIWDFGEDYEKYSTQGGGVTYKFRGSLVLTIEANTPAEFAGNTPGAYDWIFNHMQAMVGEMEALFGAAGRQEIDAHRKLEGPYRESEAGVSDYCCCTWAFDLRN